MSKTMDSMYNMHLNFRTCFSRKKCVLYTGKYGILSGRRSGLVVSALDSGSSGPGSGPRQGHCVVFSDKTLHSHGSFLHPGVSMGNGVMLGVTVQ